MQNFLFWGLDIISPNKVLKFCSPFLSGIQTFNFYFWLLWGHNQYTGLKTIVKTPYTVYQKYSTKILMIFFDHKPISQAKSKMKPKFPVPEHHDI